MTTPTIDVHAHILTEETIRLLQRESPKAAPKLSDVDDQFGTLDVAGSVYRHFPRGGWDLDRRFRDMAAAKVDVQVLSVCPQTFLYAQPPALAAAFARIQNEQLAKLVKTHPGRFQAIATIPMQAPQQAADELRHAMTVLGLRGMQIGSNIAGKNLDDPALEPIWAAAAELGAFILLHPINVAGIDRLGSYYLNNLIGNPLDTTIAAACLVFSGVLERHPSLKICLAHGGGFVPYQAGRFVHGWHVRAEKETAQAADRLAAAVLLRHHRALEGGAPIPGRQCRRRPGAARQRLSLRYGHARRRAAGPQPLAAGRRAGVDPRRLSADHARQSRRAAVGARRRRRLTEEARPRTPSSGGNPTCPNKPLPHALPAPSARVRANTCSTSPR
jgi:aminocarboxymuconate-semialdehyde decarboxylase